MQPWPAARLPVEWGASAPTLLWVSRTGCSEHDAPCGAVTSMAAVTNAVPSLTHISNSPAKVHFCGLRPACPRHCESCAFCRCCRPTGLLWSCRCEMSIAKCIATAEHALGDVIVRRCEETAGMHADHATGDRMDRARDRAARGGSNRRRDCYSRISPCDRAQRGTTGACRCVQRLQTADGPRTVAWPGAAARSRYRRYCSPVSHAGAPYVFGTAGRDPFFLELVTRRGDQRLLAMATARSEAHRRQRAIGWSRAGRIRE